MALTTPLLYTVQAFDATQEQVFTFYVVGGSQVVANTLTIKDNATLATIYSATQQSYKFQHTLPANTLSNGSYYQATLTTQDAQGNVSNASLPIQFYCFTQPTFIIGNMPATAIIENSSFSFEVTYNQIQGELLNAYVFNLYDDNRVLVSSSGTMYTSDTSLPLFINYLFSGFDDNATYFIEVNGVTVNGMNITTGLIQFTTSYTQPDLFSFLFLTNNCKEGNITIRSNVIGIPGVANPDPPTYIDNEEIDLTAQGSYVSWIEGYNISGGWTMRIWGRDFNPNTEIFRFSNASNDMITITYKTDDTQCWFELRAQNASWVWGYAVETDHIAIPADTEQLFCWVRRNNNLYDIRIENRGEIV